MVMLLAYLLFSLFKLVSRDITVVVLLLIQWACLYYGRLTFNYSKLCLRLESHCCLCCSCYAAFTSKANVVRKGGENREED